MIRQCGLILLSIILPDVMTQELVSNSHAIKCDGEPPMSVDPKTCCTIPPLFSDSDREFCGVEEDGILDPISCEQQKCLMKSQKLLDEEDEINKDAVAKFVDDWAEINEEWRESAQKAKERCLGDEIPISEKMCEANKQIYCITASLFEECAEWENEIEGCQKLRSYVDLCIYYYSNQERK